MKFVLEIEMGNDAMTTRKNVSEKLKEVARDIRLLYDLESFGIRDLNGNRVGKWEFVKK